MRRLVLVTALVFVAAVARADWPMYLHDAGHTSVSSVMPATFTPPLVVRWTATVVPPPGYPPAVWASPVGVGEDLYAVVDRGEAVDRFAAGSGDFLGVVGPKVQYTYPPAPPMYLGAAVLSDKLFWPTARTDVGLSAVGLGLTSGSAIALSRAGPPGVGTVLYAPVVAGGMVIAGDDGGRLFALTAAGKVAWTATVAGQAAGTPAVSESRNLVFSVWMVSAPGGTTGSLVASNLYGGAEAWRVSWPTTLMTSCTDGERAYVPAPLDRALLVFSATTGGLRGVWSDGAPSARATPALVGGRAIWNTGTEIVALAPDLGATVWVQPVALGNTQVAVGNGLAWAAGTGRLVALNVGDGSIAWQKQASFIPAGGYASPILLDAAGGLLILKTTRDQFIAFANEALPTRPRNVKVESHEQSIRVTWDAPPPLPADPPPAWYLVCQQGQFGAVPLPTTSALAIQEAVLNTVTGQVTMAQPGQEAQPSLPGEIGVSLGLNSTDPPSMVVAAVKAAPGAMSFEATAVSPTIPYTYTVVTVDESGVTSPPASAVGSATIGYQPMALPGVLNPGADWLEDQFDVDHTGWNQYEQVSWGYALGHWYGNVGFSGYVPRFSFAGLGEPFPPDLPRFTDPVVSQGSLYVGSSSGRLYALNAETGDPIWFVATNGPIRFPPAVIHSYAEVNGTRNVSQDAIEVVSDDGRAYIVKIGATDHYPSSVERVPYEGTAMSAPNGNARFLSRKQDGSLVDNSSGGSISLGLRVESAFWGPLGCLVVNSGSGNGSIATPIWGSIAFPPGEGPLTPAAVRPSGTPYLSDGFEILAAGFKGGWRALVVQPWATGGTLKWVPLLDNVADSPSEGIVVPFSTADAGIQGNPSFSLLTIAVSANPLTIRTGNQSDQCGSSGGCLVAYDQVQVPPLQPREQIQQQTVCHTGYVGEYGVTNCTTTYVGYAPQLSLLCPSDERVCVNLPSSYYEVLDEVGNTVTRLESTVRCVQRDWSQPKGQCYYTLNDTKVTCDLSRVHPESRCETVIPEAPAFYGDDAGLDVRKRSFVPAIALTSRQLVCRSSGDTRPLRHPTQIVIGNAEPDGRVLPTVVPDQGAVYSRGYRYTSGETLDGSGWSAPLAVRAVGVPRYFGPQAYLGLSGVTVLWVPPPGYSAEGYWIFRRGNANEPFVKIGEVAGGDTVNYSDTSSIDPADVEGTQYYVQAYNNSIGTPGHPCSDGYPPCFGAPSLPASPRLGQADTLSVSAFPTAIMRDQISVVTVRVSYEGRPAVGIPVRIRASHCALIEPGCQLPTLRRTLDGPPLPLEDDVTIQYSDPEGKVQLYYTPLVNPGVARVLAIQAEVWPPYGVAGEQTTILQTQVFQVSVYDSPADVAAVAGTVDSCYLPVENSLIAAFVRGQCGYLTGMSGLDLEPVPPAVAGAPQSFGWSGVVPTEAISAALQFDQAVCQGTSCTLPVNTRSGIVALPVVDCLLPTRGLPLLWVRTYASYPREYGVLGYGWTGSYSMRLEVVANGDVVFHGSDGGRVHYRLQPDGSFLSPNGYTDTMQRQSDGTFAMRDGYGIALTFDPEGRLRTEADRNGNTQRLSYAGSQLVRVEDDAGQWLAFTYDRQGRVGTVSDSTGRTVRYDYNDADDLVKVTRPGNEVATYAYQSGHSLSSWIDPRLPSGSKRGSLAYDDAGRVSRVYDPDGQLKHSLDYSRSGDGTSRTTITETCCGPRVDEYDSRGILVGQTDALGNRSTWVFDTNLRLVSFTDRGGHTTTAEYGPQGHPSRITDAIGNVTTYEYNSQSGFLSSVVDALGHRTTFAYDGSGNPVEMTDAAGGEWKAGRDGWGKVREMSSAMGSMETYEWNSVGDIVSITGPLGYTSRWEMDNRHRVSRFVDLRGRARRVDYSERDLPIRAWNPDGTTRQAEYDEWNRPVRVTNEMGEGRVWQFDTSDRIVSVTDPLGHSWGFAWSVQGNLMSRTDPNGYTTRVEYDAANRPVACTNPMGETVRWERDREGFATSIVDSGGVRSSLRYDALHRLVESADGRGGTWKAELDALGNRTRQVDANGHATTLGYDALSHRTSVSDPLGRTTHLAFDADGRMVGVTTAKGIGIALAYDKGGRVVERRTTLGEHDLFEYDEFGHLVRASNDAEDMRYTYDDMDRLAQVEYPRLGLAFAHDYDPVGRLVDTHYPGGSKVHYDYSAAGQLVAATDSTAGRMTMTYDDGDRAILEKWPNGLEEAFSYDAANRLLGIEPAVAGDKGLPSFHYTYDERGLRTGMVRSDAGAWAFRHDALGELVGVTMPGGSEQEYDYDPAGNRTRMKDARGSQIYAYDEADQLLRIVSDFPWEQPETPSLLASAAISDASAGPFVTSFHHDANGSMVERVSPGASVSSYQFNGYNRLVGTHQPGSAPESYAYDALGRRATRTAGFGKGVAVSRSLHDGSGRLLADVDSSGRIVCRYICTPGGQILGRVGASGNEVRAVFYHYDALGSVVAQSDFRGRVVGRWVYDPYGGRRDRGASDSPFGFLARAGVLESNTGLLIMGVRAYDPELGRFISREPTLLVGAGGNPYMYAGNSPIGRSDPSGMFEPITSFTGLVAIGAFVGVFSGGITGYAMPQEGTSRVQSALCGAVQGGVAGGMAAAAIGSAAVSSVVAAGVLYVANLEGAAAGNAAAVWVGADPEPVSLSSSAIGAVSGATMMTPMARRAMESLGAQYASVVDDEQVRMWAAYFVDTAASETASYLLQGATENAADAALSANQAKFNMIVSSFWRPSAAPTPSNSPSPSPSSPTPPSVPTTAPSSSSGSEPPSAPTPSPSPLPIGVPVSSAPGWS